MRSKGQYIALHLRLEKDVWVRTGCLPGLSAEYDDIINNERKRRPELLTARSNMSYHERRLAGLCPLNAAEVTRLLKALGAPKSARIYWAGGQPLGGREALLPLTSEFPHLYSKEDLALPGELEPFAKKASFMAAIDYIVSVNSDVFMPSHGGNMGHAIQVYSHLCSLLRFLHFLCEVYLVGICHFYTYSLASQTTYNNAFPLLIYRDTGHMQGTRSI